MDNESKVEFEEYGIRFENKDFENLSNDELKECKKIIKEIEKKIK